MSEQKAEDFGPFKLKRAYRHNPSLWQLLKEGLSNPESAITYLDLNPQLVDTDYVFQIVDAKGAVRQDDAEIIMRLKPATVRR